jgi:transposase-like protein
MAKHRTHSIEFKRQVAQEFLAGETLHGLAKRHDICRNLIRVWVQKYEAGDFARRNTSCLPSLHLLKVRSLRQTRRGSRTRIPACIVRV